MAVSPLVIGAVVVVILLLVVVVVMMMPASLPEGYVNGMIIGRSTGDIRGPWMIQGGKKRMYDMNVWIAVQPRAWIDTPEEVVNAIPTGAPILSVAMSEAADAAVAAESFAARRKQGFAARRR